MITKQDLLKAIESFVEFNLFTPLNSNTLNQLKESILFMADKTGECEDCPRRYPEVLVDISILENCKDIIIDLYQANGLRVEKINLVTIIR